MSGFEATVTSTGQHDIAPPGAGFGEFGLVGADFAGPGFAGAFPPEW